MKRWLIRIVSALFAAAVVVVSLTWLTVRASLPQLDGNVVTAIYLDPSYLKVTNRKFLQDYFLATVAVHPGVR